MNNETTIPPNWYLLQDGLYLVQVNQGAPSGVHRYLECKFVPVSNNE